MKIKIFISLLFFFFLFSCMNVKNKPKVPKQDATKVQINELKAVQEGYETENFNDPVFVFLFLILSVGVINALSLISCKKTKQAQKKL